MFSIKTKIFALFFIILSALTLILAYFSGVLKPTLLSKCEANLKLFVQDALNSAIADAADKDLYDNIINYSYSPDGKIAAYSANMLTGAKIRSSIGKYITDAVKAERETLLRFNMGLLTGIPFLYSIGPEFKVLIDGFTYSEINVSSEFTDAGINQTLHRICLEVECISHIKAPFMNEKISTETKIPISETVLIGDVPDAYTVIIRAHEEDEEDINDYAADLEN